MNISEFFKSTVPFLRGGSMLSVLFAVPTSWGVAWSAYVVQCTRRYRGYFSNDCTLDKTAYVFAAAAFTTLSIYAFYKLNSIYENLNRGEILSDANIVERPDFFIEQKQKAILSRRIMRNLTISIGAQIIVGNRIRLHCILCLQPIEYLSRLDALQIRLQEQGMGLTEAFLNNIGSDCYLNVVERQLANRRNQVSQAEKERLEIVDAQIDYFKTKFKDSSAEQLIQYHSREAGQSSLPFKVFAEHGNIQTFDVEGKKVEVMFVNGSKLNVVGDQKRPEVDKDGDAAFIVYDGRDVGEEYKISRHMLKLLKEAHKARDNQAQLAR